MGNDLANQSDWPVIEARIYIPGKPGHYEYTRMLAPETMESTPLMEFYKDDFWYNIEKVLLEEYVNDRQKKGPLSGPIERAVCRLQEWFS